jgi:hypothetical protein
MRLAAPLSILLALALSGCDRSSCDQTCRHLAKCKREKQVGAAIPGESAPEANPTCMARCEAQKPEFQACEAKYRECDKALACISY